MGSGGGGAGPLYMCGSYLGRWSGYTSGIQNMPLSTTMKWACSLIFVFNIAFPFRFCTYGGWANWVGGRSPDLAHLTATYVDCVLLMRNND